MTGIKLNTAAGQPQPGFFSMARTFGQSLAGRLAARLAVALAAAAFFIGTTNVAYAGKPELDPSYADGKTYYMIGPHTITDPSPQMFEQSQELYIVAYPWDGITPPVFASGYAPQCNPCYHPGLLAPFVYHDHVLSGAPGLGNQGTAGQFMGPWKIIVLLYNPAVLTDPTFQPVTSEVDLDAAEAAGEFQVINPGAANPFEFITGAVLICPLVSPDA